MYQGSYRPWAVYVYINAVQRKELGRFTNRIDADHQVLMLKRFAPHHQYEAVFEPLTVETLLKHQHGDPYNHPPEPPPE